MVQLRDFAARQGWTIQREFVDRMTGKTANRPQFQSMFAAAARREFDLVLFWSLDRLQPRRRVGNASALAKTDGLRRWLEVADGAISRFGWPVRRRRAGHSGLCREAGAHPVERKNARPGLPARAVKARRSGARAWWRIGRRSSSYARVGWPRRHRRKAIHEQDYRCQDRRRFAAGGGALRSVAPATGSARLPTLYFTGLSTSFSLCLPSPEIATTVNVLTSADKAGNRNHARSESRS